MNRALSSIFKSYSIYQYPIKKNIDKNILGRWKLNDNIEKKIDLANLDNCGDRVCGIPTENFKIDPAIIDNYYKQYIEKIKNQK